MTKKPRTCRDRFGANGVRCRYGDQTIDSAAEFSLPSAACGHLVKNDLQSGDCASGPTTFNAARAAMING